nr:MAG TPA: hypothetical protein [Caudoviricetes sp.]
MFSTGHLFAITFRLLYNKVTKYLKHYFAANIRIII